jgi:CRISPR system Cascade subunit CasA
VRRGRPVAAILALGLAGCVAYAPAPPHPAQYAATVDSRRLDRPPASGVWTGADLLAVAIAQNPQIAEARAKYVTALATLKASKAWQGPSLTLTAEYATEQPHWGYSGAGTIPLDYGARRSTRIGTAELQALQAWYDLGEAVWSVRTDLERARGDALAASAEIGLAEQSVVLRRQRFERLERRVTAGQDARAVAITAQTDLVNAERRLAAARGRRDAADAALAKALGVSPPAVRGLALAPPPGVPPLDQLPSWRLDAALSRRDVLRAIADYDIAEQALRQQVALQYPTVSLGPAYNYDHGVHKYPFSIDLALPPWDLNRGQIRQAEATRAEAGRALESVQANALAAVDAAAAALATAKDDAERTRTRDVPLAERTAANAARAVSAGESDRTDELAARAAVVDAQLALNDARHTLAGATADLEDALRRAFDPAETALIEAAMVPEKARLGGRAK